MPIEKGLRSLSEIEARVERRKKKLARKKKANAIGSRVRNMFKKRRVA